MRQSKLLLPTLREVPAEAEVVSHQLMVRAGMVRQLAAGIYTYLPLGFRVLHKVTQIVREEMDRAGAQEILCSAIQPAELWMESGRWDDYGPELMRLEDRHGRQFVLGPTHEEVFTSLVRNEVRSYKKLPLILYQIQTKYRDERRPRFGVMRAREFLMKDAYSFDVDQEGMDQSYKAMYDAYTRIFSRCGLRFRAVEADGGAIGGEGGTHEFMALSDVGEDTIVVCPSCEYAANLELAEAIPADGPPVPEEVPPLRLLDTPGVRTIADCVSKYGMEIHRIFKTVVYAVDGQPTAVVVRGDHSVNEVKLKNLMRAKQVEILPEEEIKKVVGAGSGSVGPVGIRMDVVADHSVPRVRAGFAGANQDGKHYANVQPGRDFTWSLLGDIRNVAEGDRCPKCGDELRFYRGIEVGHVFKLGTKYSEALKAKYLDDQGQERLMIMGCYGIGVSRLLAAVIEQHSDRDGICWPPSIAPFHVHLVPVSLRDTVQTTLAEQLYQRFRDQGYDVLLDDRDERPGVKFKDADLIGCPVRVTIGSKAADGIVEVKFRASGEVRTASVEEAFQMVLDSL
jgi:prolyl-tRNA synthetase